MGKGLALLGVPVLGGKGDVIAPTCVVSSAAGDPVYAAFSVTITFSEDVTGFVIGDITVTNGAASNFVAVSGSVYTADITPTTAGAVTVDVAAGVCADAAGNNNTAATQLSRTCWLPSAVTGLVLELDANDPSSLFQDAECTTPAALEDDPIGGWKTRTDNGVIFTAATTRRPSLQLNVLNGGPAIRSNGQNELLGNAAALALLQNTGYAYIFALYAANHTDATRRTVYAWRTNDNIASRVLLEDGFTANLFRVGVRRPDATSYLISSDTNHGGTAHVLSLLITFAADSPTVIMRQDGTQVLSGALGSAAATDNTPSAAAGLFANGAFKFCSVGDLYALLVYTPATPMAAGDITAIEAYLTSWPHP